LGMSELSSSGRSRTSELLLDACVWGGAKKYLADKGHDVLWAGDWPEDPGDREILERAHNEGRVLVTLDKDFGEIAIFRGTPHYGILRLVDIAASDKVRFATR
jgi:predicted nuclease of predicted toxin-antitoxin system